MKFFFTIAILIGTVYSVSNAQNYHPLLSKSNTWFVDVTNTIRPGRTGDYNKPWFQKYTIKYSATGDSLIKNVKYKKFYVTDSLSKYSDIDTGFVGLLREDTQRRQVFFLQKDSMREWLVYDFKLKTGDSIFINFNSFGNDPPSSNWYKATDTGSVKTFDGNIQKTCFGYITGSKNETLTWVEGLGCLSSPLYFLHPFNDNVYTQSVVGGSFTGIIQCHLGCAFRDGIQIYGGSVCEYKYLDIDYDQPETLDISYIHAQSNQLRFSTTGMIDNDIQICIYDLVGHQVFKTNTKVFPNVFQSYTIGFLNPLKSGVYEVIFTNAVGNFIQKVVIYN